DVVAITLQIDVLGREVHLQSNLRIRGGELGDEIEKPRVHHRRRRYAQIPANAIVVAPDARLGLGNGVENDAGVSVERLSGVRDRQAARRAAKKTHAEPVLESGKAPAQRGTRDPELDGGA